MGTARMPEVVTGYQWELYNITEDFSQHNDLTWVRRDRA
jgi:arylsulfatase